MNAKQVYTGKNGVKVYYPMGYASFQAYVDNLRGNLKMAQTHPRFAKHIPKIEATLKAVEAAL